MSFNNVNPLMRPEASYFSPTQLDSPPLTPGLASFDKSAFSRGPNPAQIKQALRGLPQQKSLARGRFSSPLHLKTTDAPAFTSPWGFGRRDSTNTLATIDDNEDGLAHQRPLMSRTRQFSESSTMTADEPEFTSPFQQHARRDSAASVSTVVDHDAPAFFKDTLGKRQSASYARYTRHARSRSGSITEMTKARPRHGSAASEMTLFDIDATVPGKSDRKVLEEDVGLHNALTPVTEMTDPFRDTATTQLVPDEVIEELELEDEDEVPVVAPLFEVVDPQIPVAEPELATAFVSEPVVRERHPWSFPPYNVVKRPAPVIRPVVATIKVSLSLSAVFSLMIGYGLRVKVIRIGTWSFGMYGLLLVIDFLVQASAATVNRHRVAKLTKESPITKGVAALHKTDALPTATPHALPECSIAVVGYREDEEAWISCLKSLQAQEFPIKHIIGVVDGNDGPDHDMANAFGKAFPEEQRLIVHLPVLFSMMYKQKYWESLEILGYGRELTWRQRVRMWFTQEPRPGQEAAHEIAWAHMLDYLHERATAERWADWKGVCFTQPHGHKRHAMFTAFVVGAYALGTKDAMLTTDSDTYVHPDAVTNLMALLYSDPKMAGVTGDVRIWNKTESFLARMSALRYWFAFNVERACQSAFGCVGCLSGPLGLYKTSDLISILGPWILQSFLGKETTFGDDRHLSNRILSLGHKTGYTHLAICDSDTPAGYVRWVKQQTRWSKSFFREAFWFPKSFAFHDFWLTVETTKQFLYPMILTATVLEMLYKPGAIYKPGVWLGTMFGVAMIKSLYGVIAMRDPTYLLFGVYGFMYFFGLLPSKLFACFTVGITTWGTSARSKSEFARPESFYSRTTHVGHLAVWYLALSVGLGYFLFFNLGLTWLWLVGCIGLAPVMHAYSDVIIGETRYFLFMLKKWRQGRRSAADLEQGRAVRRWRIVKRRVPVSPPAHPEAPATDEKDADSDPEKALPAEALSEKEAEMKSYENEKTDQASMGFVGIDRAVPEFMKDTCTNMSSRRRRSTVTTLVDSVTRTSTTTTTAPGQPEATPVVGGSPALPLSRTSTMASGDGHGSIHSISRSVDTSVDDEPSAGLLPASALSSDAAGGSSTTEGKKSTLRGAGGSIAFQRRVRRYAARKFSP